MPDRGDRGGTAAVRRFVANRWPLRWSAGALSGTLLIAFTSPLFVRSYVPLRQDPVRGDWTMPPGAAYRWRSEGYATTHVGPQGMPGRPRMPTPTDRRLRVALWGDSQAEGVCLDDDRKLFAQAERLSRRRAESRDERRDDGLRDDGLRDDGLRDDGLRRGDPGEGIVVLPFPHSGTDAGNWLPQMPRVEPAFAIDAHAILVVDLPDLLPAAMMSPPVGPPGPVPDQGRTLDPAPGPTAGEDVAGGFRPLAAWLPAFVIQAGRRWLTEADGTTRRRWRFAPGPVRQVTDGGTSADGVATAKADPFDWPAIMGGIRHHTSLPVIVLYAPPAPLIVDGRLVETAPHEEQWPAMRDAAAAAGVTLVDLREPLRRSAARGVFPHGFHNGQIGVGHLNHAGTRIVARGLSDASAEVSRVRTRSPRIAP